MVGKRANTSNMSFTFFFYMFQICVAKTAPDAVSRNYLVLRFFRYPSMFYALMKRDDLITLLPCRVTLKLSLIEVCPICFPSRKLTFEESLFSINSTKSIKLIMHNENPNRVH